MCSMMFKQRRNFENNIFWNAQHNLREKGLNQFNEVMEIIKMATEKAVLKIKKCKNKEVIGWDKYVRYFKDRSIFGMRYGNRLVVLMME